MKKYHSIIEVIKYYNTNHKFPSEKEDSGFYHWIVRQYKKGNPELVKYIKSTCTIEGLIDFYKYNQKLPTPHCGNVWLWRWYTKEKMSNEVSNFVNLVTMKEASKEAEVMLEVILTDSKFSLDFAETMKKNTKKEEQVKEERPDILDFIETKEEKVFEPAKKVEEIAVQTSYSPLGDVIDDYKKEFIAKIKAEIKSRLGNDDFVNINAKVDVEVSFHC